MIFFILFLFKCSSKIDCNSLECLNDTDNHIYVDNTDYQIPQSIRYLGEENGWFRNQKNLISNFYSMYQPEVIYIPERDNSVDYPYFMWFFGWSYNQENEPEGKFPGFPGGDAIFCARAKALEGPWQIWSKNWDNGIDFWDAEQNPFFWQPVIVCQNIWYDSWHVGDPSIVYRNKIFYMAYSSMGTDKDGIPSHKSGDIDGNASCIMGATSIDGINWTLSKNPLLVWDWERGFNEKEKKQGYYGGYQRPSLMFDDGKWKIWYDYQVSNIGVYIGYAENVGDFMSSANWINIHYNEKPLIKGVDFDVVKIGKIYYAYGDPYLNWFGIYDEDIPVYPIDQSRWSNRQIVEYQSENGFNWYVTGYFHPDADYPANQIPQVFLDHKSNSVCIFYATQRGLSQGAASYDWRWNNIRMMSRNINMFSKIN